jgi:hypothetical protein
MKFDVRAIDLCFGREALTAVTMKSSTCNAAQPGQFPTAYSLLLAGLLFVSVVDPDGGGSNVLRNACRLLLDYARLNSRSEYISPDICLQ